MTTPLMALGQQALTAQPFSALLGTELLAFAEGRAELGLAVRPELLQQHGLVHGGVLAYLADNALTFAGGSVLGEAVLTSEFKINYVRPARGERLVARAVVLTGGQTQVVCRCEVYSIAGEQEKLCAAAQGTIVKAG